MDLDVGETESVKLHDVNTVEAELLAVEPITDSVLDAVFEGNVTVYINGRKEVVKSGNYHL